MSLAFCTSCLPSSRRRREREADREPLLPRHQTGHSDPTALQRSLHHKMRVYQMVLALSHGYVPSTEQLIANLRAVLATDALNANLNHNSGYGLSSSGRRLVWETREFVKALITLVAHKNNEDQIQELLWNLTQSRVSVDVKDVRKRMGKAKQKADVVAAYQSIQTIGSLLMSNSEFRILISDITVLGRQVFKDAAYSLSGAAEDVGQQLSGPQSSGDFVNNEIQPSETKLVNNGSPPTKGHEDKITVDGERKIPSPDDLGKTVTEVTGLVKEGSTKVLEETRASAADKLSRKDNRQVLLARLKGAVQTLAQKPDYETAVDTLSKLVKRFILTYSRALEEAVAVAEDDVHENEEADEAVKSAWSLAISFGDPDEWTRLKESFDKVIGHRERDPEFEELAGETVDSFEKLLTDPDFGENIDEKFQQLRKKSKKLDSESDLRRDIDELLEQLQITARSVLNDKDVANLLDRASRILQIISPEGAFLSDDLVRDGINVFTPALISAIQTIPIPRLEVSTPSLDLLLENIFVTPGHTVNNSSFLPYHLRISTFNALDVHKHRVSSQVSSQLSTSFSISLSGFSLRAEDIGYVIKTHYPLIPFTSSGLASVALDERGTDVEINVDVERNSLENILKLKAVKVHVHKLSYKLTNSPFSLIAWILKPFLRPILRKVMEKEIARGIAGGIKALNREFLFARERTRAVQVTQPGSIWALFKALKARWTPEQDPDMDVRVGFDAPSDRSSNFQGVYAPGSLAGMWWEEERRREELEVVDRTSAWRSSVFDVGA